MRLLKELVLLSFNYKICSILCLAAVILIIYQKYYKYQDITSKLYTFHGLPLLGTVLQVLPINKFLYKLGSYFNKSLTFVTWLGMRPIIVTIDPVIIKHVLNSEEFLNKANVLYKSMDNALPDGLITSKFFKWKHNRKLMNPSFTPQILQRFIPIFVRGTENILQYFDSLQDDGEHSILGFLQNTVMQIALKTIMGLELESQDTVSQEMVTKIHMLMEKICLDTALSPMQLGFLVRNSSYYNILEYLQIFLKKLISDRTAKTAANDKTEYFLNRALKYQHQGLFHSGDTITETYTMISGSYETTSTTLFSLIVMLAMHPDVQEKLYQEVISTIPSYEQITYDHLDQLPYLNMVISETLRLVPPIPFIGRETLESCKLTNEVTLPRGFEVLISLFHLHRCESLWGPDAHRFNPDNFLPEQIQQRYSYAYVPFSKGVRNCIGWRYADASLRFLILGLIRRYKFLTSFSYEDLYFVQKISLQYLEEPKMQIIRRI